MFIGHFAVGLAAKRVAPRASLWGLMVAPMWADLIWPILVLAGIERLHIQPGATAVTPLVFDSYPISHSLATLVGWGILLGAAYWSFTHYRAGAIAIAVGVVSHWVLDWIAHARDLQLAPWDPARFGLGLWNSVAGTVVVEIGLFLLGAAAYARTTRPRDGVGRWSFVAFVVVALAIFLGDTFAHSIPPSPHSVALVALTGWLVPFWAWWFDRHRDARERVLAATSHSR